MAQCPSPACDARTHLPLRCCVAHPCRHDLPIADWNGYPLPMVSRKGKPSRPNAEELVWLLRASAVIPNFLSQFPLQARVR